MKRTKNMFISLLITLALVMSYGGFVLADEPATPDTDGDTASAEEYSNDELAEQYILQEFAVDDDAVCYATYNYTSMLNSESSAVYNYLNGKIKQIASGEITNTVITLPASYSYTFTAAQLGMSDLTSNSSLLKQRISANMPVKSSAIKTALQRACPYDMYWFDKTVGMSYTYAYTYTSQSVTVYNLTFAFSVEKEYQYNGNEYQVNPAYGQSVKTAAANAKSIINAYAGLGDYDKLKAYNDAICALTEYNDNAAKDESMPYGNPWQLVWVFDNDPSTKVVCEGYAKSFQYLCDNSTFKDSSVYAISVSGIAQYLTNGGGHMWNIVHIGGANYIVDVTNNDGYTNPKYFLIGGSGSPDTSYVVANGAKYTYYDSIKSCFTTESLTLSGTNYDPNAAPSSPGTGSGSGSSSGSPSDPAPIIIDTVKLTSGMAHVQDIGDVTVTANDSTGILTIGTTGMGKRLEEITINFINNTSYSGTLEYRVHVQDIGWMDWVQAGQKAGTEGLSKRIEAIEIRLTGELADYYSVEYCVHIQDYGNMQGWVKDGALAGTTGESKRIEELKIRIVPKGYDNIMTVKYRVHVQDLGWESAYASNGQMSGTSGQAKRLEGIEIFLTGGQYSGGIKYKTHIQNIGWESAWSKDGEMSGTQGQALRLEGISIELYGEVAEYYDVYYRVHAQDIGWLSWAKNGEYAGTAGRSARLEGIQIVLVPKGDPAPSSTYAGITAVDSRCFVEGF